MRAAGFERVFQFSNYNYGLDYWSGIRQRTSVPLPFLWLVRPGAGRQWRRRHAVEHYADVVQRAGIAIEDWRLRMYITVDEIAARDHLLQANGVRPNEPVVGIHPGGEGLYGRKQWSREGFAAVADGLHQRFGVKILVLGGKDDARAAAEVAALSSAPVLNLAGQTTLGATAAMAARCALFVGNDSSPLHLAVAAGTRVVGIYGITDPQSFHPWLPGGQPGRDFAVVRSPAPCGCCFPQLGGASLPEVIRCLRCHPFDSITPERVLDAAVPLLAAQMR